MTKEKEISMLLVAKILTRTPIDKVSEEDFKMMFDHDPIQGSFICGVCRAEQNPESPWMSIADRMPEDSLPVLSNPKKIIKKPIKVMVCMRNGQVMQATRRTSIDGIWYFNIPLCMRDQITHWMPLPPLPEEIRNENNR